MQPHSKRWLRIVVATFYVIIPLTITAGAVITDPPEPYLISEVPIPYQPVEFEYLATHRSQETAIEPATYLAITSTVTLTPAEAAPPPEPEATAELEAQAPEPEPVEEAVAELEPEQPPAPEPEPPAEETGVEHSSGVEQWRGLVTAYFPASEVEYAMCIMDHESGGDPGATNSSSGAAGLFQFIPSTWNNMVPDELAGDVYDPETNVRAAAWLQGAEGWSQWSPHNRGAC